MVLYGVNDSFFCRQINGLHIVSSRAGAQIGLWLLNGFDAWSNACLYVDFALNKDFLPIILGFHRMSSHVSYGRSN
jgi:hypothetical protein